MIPSQKNYLLTSQLKKCHHPVFILYKVMKLFQKLASESPHTGEQWTVPLSDLLIHICQLHWRIFMAWSLPRFALPVSKWRCVIEKWVHQIVSKLVFMQGSAHLWEKWKAWCVNFCQACHQLMWVKTSFCTVCPVLHSALVAFLRIIPTMKVIGSLDTHFPKSWAAVSECLTLMCFFICRLLHNVSYPLTIEVAHFPSCY